MSFGYPKEPREENAHLRDMAQKFGCYLRIHSLCTGEHFTETTVLAHENSLNANKGTGLKSHDWTGVFACARCHSELDQGMAYDLPTKKQLMARAQRRMVLLYQQIVSSPTSKAKDRAAAQWALDSLVPRLLKLEAS